MKELKIVAEMAAEESNRQGVNRANNFLSRFLPYVGTMMAAALRMAVVDEARNSNVGGACDEVPDWAGSMLYMLFIAHGASLEWQGSVGGSSLSN